MSSRESFLALLQLSHPLGLRGLHHGMVVSGFQEGERVTAPNPLPVQALSLIQCHLCPILLVRLGSMVQKQVPDLDGSVLGIANGFSTREW